MPSTLLLDRVSWDLVLDTDGNIAVAAEPYSLAQDAASAIKTFLGECFWDTTIGIPYLSQIFSKKYSFSLIKSQMVQAALTVSGVVSAKCFLVSFNNKRDLTLQVQVTSASGAVTAATFTVVNPQGTG